LDAGAAVGTAADFAACLLATKAYLRQYCHSRLLVLAGCLLPCAHTC
jgi:hypothetical protein